MGAEATTGWEGVPLCEEWTPTRWGIIFARRGGADREGVPVVLVHGLVVSSSYMVPTAELLGRYFPTYALDLPGFGRSSKEAEALGVAGLAVALNDWVLAKGFPLVHLVANSLGCQIVSEFAVRFPGRTGKVVFLGPTVDRHARSFWPQLWRQILDMPHEARGLVPCIARDYFAAGLVRSLVTVRETLNDRIEERLPRMTMPTLVVSGAHDPICPQHWAEEVTALLPYGELRVVPHGWHALNYSQPREVVRLVRPFLAA